MKNEDRGFNITGYIFLILFIAMVILPFVVLVSSSLVDESALIRDGFPIIPSKINLSAYSYIYSNIQMFVKAFGISTIVTLSGTIINVLLTILFAYPLSRKDFPYRRFFSFFIIVSILFNGGLIPTYLVYTEVFKIKNTLFGYIVPNLLMSGFTVMIARSYFTNNLHHEIIEAAKIDGASEWTILTKIVIPITTPIIVTLAILAGMAYWNDWANGLIYVTDWDLYGLQNLLYRIVASAQFLNRNVPPSISSAQVRLPVETVKMAVAFIACLPIIVAYIVLQKAFLRGISMGALKE